MPISNEKQHLLESPEALTIFEILLLAEAYQIDPLELCKAVIDDFQREKGNFIQSVTESYEEKF